MNKPMKNIAIICLLLALATGCRTRDFHEFYPHQYHRVPSEQYANAVQVYGHVESPGAYRWIAGLDSVVLLDSAKANIGFGEHVYIIRQGALHVYYPMTRTHGVPDYFTLQPGDIIVVPVQDAGLSAWNKVQVEAEAARNAARPEP
ncbi:MAG: hypothetical protein WCN95_11380 [bacterium]